MKFKVFILMIFINSILGDRCNAKGNFDETSKECICTNKYITYPKSSIVQCNYERRSKNVTIFLAILGGAIGADQFYLGNNIKALFKVLFPIVLFIIIMKTHEKKIFNIDYR
jgi:hypothetical protein